MFLSFFVVRFCWFCYCVLHFFALLYVSLYSKTCSLCFTRKKPISIGFKEKRVEYHKLYRLYFFCLFFPFFLRSSFVPFNFACENRLLINLCIREKNENKMLCYLRRIGACFVFVFSLYSFFL